MEKTDIIRTMKTPLEQAESIAKSIRYFDSQVFEKSLPVEISNNPAFANKGVAIFLVKNWFFRILGFKDEYLIFTKIHQSEELMKRPFGATGVSLHEVRHRFQHHNGSCLISEDFARLHHHIFNKDMIERLCNLGIKYRKTDVRRMEFDASIVEWIFVLNSGKKSMTHGVIIELITCNENNILQIITSLK